MFRASATLTSVNKVTLVCPASIFCQCLQCISARSEAFLSVRSAPLRRARTLEPKRRRRMFSESADWRVIRPLGHTTELITSIDFYFFLVGGPAGAPLGAPWAPRVLAWIMGIFAEITPVGKSGGEGLSFPVRSS